MGYKIGYSFTGAIAAKRFGIEELDLRSNKAPVLTEDMIKPLDPKVDSNFWEGVGRGFHARLQEMEPIIPKKP